MVKTTQDASEKRRTAYPLTAPMIGLRMEDIRVQLTRKLLLYASATVNSLNVGQGGLDGVVFTLFVLHFLDVCTG